MLGKESQSDRGKITFYAGNASEFLPKHLRKYKCKHRHYNESVIECSRKTFVRTANPKIGWNDERERGLVMQISSRFTLAVHIFACIDTFGGEYKVTSDFLAGSTNVNAVVIRRILVQLKEAGLIEVARGTGGTTIAKPLDEITFLDVYRAVECVENGELFHFHENPSTNCPVGRNIHHILDDKLLRVQNAMEVELASITLEDLRRDTEKYLGNQK